MTVEICTLGGYNEVGKNMTAVRVDDEVIILDMGLDLENYIKYTEEEREELGVISGAKLIKVGALADIGIIDDWKKDVKAIVATHGHLDHIGGIPHLSNRFKADILCTPMTGALLETICKDDKIHLKNKIRVLSPNSVFTISDKIKIEFVHMTHSTPQTVVVAIHTKDGIILYANDFKFDNWPVLGKKPNMKRLGELGKEGVLALIADSIYSKAPIKTPSEQVAKDMLKDVLLGTDSSGKAIIVTTFSSHLARLKSIIELGKQLNRKIVFLGRSLVKYVKAGEKVGIIDFRDVKLVKYRRKIGDELKRIEHDGREKYLLVVTGHQGEPKAVLSRMVNRELPLYIKKGDHIIFSCRIIPTELSIKNRKVLEQGLKRIGARIFRDIHVSGHASGEDDRDLLELVNPKHVIPAHADDEKKSGLIDLAKEAGKKAHLMKNGQRLKLS